MNMRPIYPLIFGLFLAIESNAKDLVFLNRSAYSVMDIPIELLIEAEVVTAIDGDTIGVRILSKNELLAKYEKVRFIGVDTPETKDPRKAVQYFGKEAAAYTRYNLLSEKVYLCFDTTLRDRYDRLLCYIILSDRQVFNYNLIINGYGFAYTTFPFQYMREFKEAETKAKREGNGLWKRKQ